jgi:serine/threonine protein kinase
MRNKDQFMREISARKDNELDSKFVVGISKEYDGDDDPKFLEAVSRRAELAGYKYAIVMPCADRNMDTIFRSERPDLNTVRAHAQQVAESIQHLHDQGIVHGDLKLLNIVRIGHRLCLIDLDACSKFNKPSDETLHKFFASSKFSSATLPPEFIHPLKNDAEVGQFRVYFGGGGGGGAKTSEPNLGASGDADAQLWAKVEPRVLKQPGGKKSLKYVVKTFLTEVVKVKDDAYESGFNKIEQPRNPSELPYALVEASPSLDLWSFGLFLYQLLTGTSLFKANRDDDLDGPEAMHELATWSESKKFAKLKNVADVTARDLLSQLLSRNASDRPKSMVEVLEHSFFTTVSDVTSDISKLAESLDRKAKDDKAAFARLEAGQAQLIDMSSKTIAMVKQSTSVICRSIFEATEVSINL